ncbi:probable glucosamine 6-phosphate N-acetyltransferase [Panonychus citri]|uniref:probable glucosamine 6-phosphate N-acetyltransferase n=1 Tax=Panonychus citri TaxID=50023 RepID=UPI002307F09E|nr:probable glucosamine 6-phosphate N-acetyltransferase [Panonychus citri]
MSVVNGDCYLFNPIEIEDLDWTNVQIDCKDKLDSNSLIIRPLKIDDYGRGHIKLLSQLTVVGDVSQQEYEDRFKLMKETKLIKTVVIEDTNSNLIAGTATLLCEPKFIHSCSWTGHVQDVCVDNSYRGIGLGKLIVNCLKLLAQKLGAYKVDLDCADEKIRFYNGLGFKQESGRANYLALRFPN